MYLVTYLELLHGSQGLLAASYRTVAQGHGGDPEVHYTCGRFADDCVAHAAALEPILASYRAIDAGGASDGAAPPRLHPVGIHEPRTGPVGLLRDLQDLDHLANLLQTTGTLVGQAAHAVRDRELIKLVAAGERDISAQLAWLRARMRSLAPQALVAAR